MATTSEKLSAYAGPAITTVDISRKVHQQTIIALGTPEVILGHCDAVLLPAGKTMLTAWTGQPARLFGLPRRFARLAAREPRKANFDSSPNTPINDLTL